MKQDLTGKQINEWAQKVNDLPDYWGDSYYPNESTFYYNDRQKKVKGEFIAKKYRAIVNLIVETKAAVHITPDEILIEYTQGQSKIKRDILTDNFLLPLININAGFSSVPA